TEHACLTAQALITSAGEAGAFARQLARRLRFWLLGLPLGTGRATLKATLKLWLGFPPSRSGVFSAGNGPAMRAPILGVCAGHDPPRLRELVRVSTRITHTDPKAEYGAYAAALAAHAFADPSTPVSPDAFRQRLRDDLGEEANELHTLIRLAAESAAAGAGTEEFAASLGLRRGVSGYVYHTVPVALHTAWRHPDDFRAAVEAAVRCGGDTDSVAAIVGGMVGARVGRAGLPADWLGGLWEWPRTAGWMERLGQRLAEVLGKGEPAQALPINPLGLLARNLLFDLLVLAHALRRLLPPY
ncbi:MAG TPA: ADP-ribosylglycohydrolase family protein, partial [Gemmataceae bacterium]